VPHAAHDSQVSFVTEGNGVGVLKAPPVSAAGLAADSSTSRSSSLFPAPNQSSCGLQPPPSGGKYGPLAPDPPPAVNLCFKVSPAAGLEVEWETILLESRLYVEVPPGILPEGSRESLIELLEYAEEKLKCSHVILCFKRARPDRGSLLRVFNFFGFWVLPPSHALAPRSEDLLYMAYAIDGDAASSSSEDDDDDDDDKSDDCGSQ